MDVMEAIYKRRAVRAYTSRKVDRETIDKLIKAATMAPSAMNTQPWAFAVIQDSQRLNSISERALKMVLAAIADKPELAKLREKISTPGFNCFYGASTLIVICADSAGMNPLEDCSLAGENLMLAATAMGLASCPIGLARGLLNTPEVKAELGIGAEFTPVLPIIVGYADGALPEAPPRNPTRVLCWK
ncbi:MAG TPA: nitroreductase [Planctomycetota bacterium]|jgi:nitroreductase